MSKLINSLESITFDKNRDRTYPINGAVLRGNFKDGTNGRLLHISKPKHLSLEDLNEIIDRLQIGIQTRIS